MTDETGGSSEVEMGALKVNAVGHAEQPKEDDKSIEYGGGAEPDPMEAMIAEDAEIAIPAEEEMQVEDSVVVPEAEMADEAIIPMEPQETQATTITPGSSIDESKIKTDPTLTESDKPSFNPDEVQSPLKDAPNEGGIVKTRTTGPTMSQPKLSDSGEQLKPKPDMLKDSLIGKFEVTGFDAEYEINGNVHTVPIRDYFDDLELAFMSVNGEKYLMPMPKGTFKVARVSNGAPTISFNERQVYNYKNGAWVRT